jgi:hypothetical protein
MPKPRGGSGRGSGSRDGGRGGGGRGRGRGDIGGRGRGRGVRGGVQGRSVEKDLKNGKGKGGGKGGGKGKERSSSSSRHATPQTHDKLRVKELAMTESGDLKVRKKHSLFFSHKLFFLTLVIHFFLFSIDISLLQSESHVSM